MEIYLLLISLASFIPALPVAGQELLGVPDQEVPLETPLSLAGLAPQEALPNTLVYLNTKWNKDLVLLLYQKMKGCSANARMAVRGIFHEGGTFDRCKKGPSSVRGGFTGSMQFEKKSPANQNLIKIIDDYLAIKKQFKGTSFADLVALGGAIGIRVCGGPEITVFPGRVDATLKDVSDLPGFLLGSIETNMVNGMGFTHLEAVALIAGGHSIAFRKTAAGKDDLPLDGTPTKIDTKFLREMLKLDAADPKKITKLGIDMELLDNPKLKDAMKTLAANTATLHAVFKQAIEKLVILGTKADNFSKCPK